METDLRMNAYSNVSVEAKTEVRLPWYVWLLAWICTSLTGGIFGAFFLLLQGGPGGFRLAGAGFLMGCYLAALVGALLIPTFGLLAGLLRLRGRNSLGMMTITGGATGLMSGVIVGPLCVLTCAFGAFGARFPGQLHLNRTRIAK